MLDFLPIEFFPCPEEIPVMVKLVDERYCFAKNHSDAYDSHWIIQFPFEEPQGAHHGMIESWAPLPANYYHDKLLKEHKYGD